MKKSVLLNLEGLRETPSDINLPQVTVSQELILSSNQIVKKEKKYLTETFVKLFHAIEMGNKAHIRKLIREGLSVSDIMDSTTKTTLLHIAAKFSKDIEIWEILFSVPEILNWIDVQNVDGTSPLIAAVWYNNQQAVKFLASKQANFNLYIKDTRMTALHCAAVLPTANVTKLLLKYSRKKKLLLDVLDIEGNTPLMLAVNKDSPSIVVLLDEGADLKKKNSVTGRNILHMAIVNGNYHLIEMLVEMCTDSDFVDALDKNGDSPFMLAIRLDVEMAIEILLRAKNLGAILSRSLLSLHSIVSKGKYKIMEILLNLVDDKSIFNFVDSRGRTVLIHAIEKRDTAMVMTLLNYGVNYKVRNYQTGETVLHAAAYANDETIIKVILELSGINEIINVRDHKGATAYDIVLGKGDRGIWHVFNDTGLIPEDYRNIDGESSLFIAAKEGNTYLVLTLLLSDKFNHTFTRFPMTLRKEELLSYEMEGLIYASDVFIAGGYDIGRRRWKLGPRQDHLFALNVHGQNIFHATALSESAECGSLIYEYCLRFNGRHTDIDRPDNYGNTPIMFALESGSMQLVKSYLKKGINISFENEKSQMPLDKFNYNLPYWESLIIEVINECAIVEQNCKEEEKPFGELVINFEPFCPKDAPQMQVISSIFKKLRGSDAMKILENPIIEYFVLTKWEKIRDMLGIRFFLYAIMVIFLSTYLTFTMCIFLGLDDFLYNFLVNFLIFMSVLMILFNIPLLFMRKRKVFVLVVICPFCTLLYFYINKVNRTAFEVSAGAVLFGWLSVLVQGYVTHMSFEIATLFHVIKAVMGHLPMCIILLLAFSNCFFTLYHDFLPFNNPIHSFLTTGIFLLDSENILPSFNSEVEPFRARPHLFKSWDKEQDRIDGEKEMRSMLIEGSILMAFDILVTVCVLNMLLGLAVKSGTQLEKEGSVHRIRIYVEELTVWEEFLETKFYKFVTRLNLFWLFGLVKDLKKKMTVPVNYRPISENKEVEFNLQKLRNSAKSLTNISDVHIPTFRDFLIKERTDKKYELSRGSRAMSNIAWIYNKWDLE